MEALKDLNSFEQKEIKYFIEKKINNFIKNAVYIPIKINLLKNIKNQDVIKSIETELFRKNILRKISKQIFKIKHYEAPKEIKHIIQNMSDEDMLLIVNNKIDVLIKYYIDRLDSEEITKETCKQYEYKKVGRERTKLVNSSLQTIKGHKTKILVANAMLKAIKQKNIKLNKNGTKRKSITGPNLAKFINNVKLDMLNKIVCHYNKFIEETLFDENTTEKDKILVYIKFLKQEISRLNSLVRQVRKIFKIIPKKNKFVDQLEIKYIPSDNQLGKKRKPYKKVFNSLRENIIYLRVA